MARIFRITLLYISSIIITSASISSIYYSISTPIYSIIYTFSIMIMCFRIIFFLWFSTWSWTCCWCSIFTSIHILSIFSIVPSLWDLLICSWHQMFIGYAIMNLSINSILIIFFCRTWSFKYTSIIIVLKYYILTTRTWCRYIIWIPWPTSTITYYTIFPYLDSCWTCRQYSKSMCIKIRIRWIWFLCLSFFKIITYILTFWCITWRILWT